VPRSHSVLHPCLKRPLLLVSVSGGVLRDFGVPVLYLFAGHDRTTTPAVVRRTVGVAIRHRSDDIGRVASENVNDRANVVGVPSLLKDVVQEPAVRRFALQISQKARILVGLLPIWERSV